MADVAAHLVDEVFPEDPVRQWVCSLPWRLRYAMGYDRKLCADVLDAFIVSLCPRATRPRLRMRACRETRLLGGKKVSRSTASTRVSCSSKASSPRAPAEARRAED